MNHNSAVNSKVSKNYKVSELKGPHDRQRLFVGIDIGSTSSDVVVLDGQNKVLFSNYQRTKGRPIETAYRQLKDMFSIFNNQQIALAAVTGSAGRFLAEILDIPFVNEVSAQAKAIRHLYPEFGQATIIEMGGQDSKLIFLSGDKKAALLKDFALNTVCAAGTGSFLDQQAARLGVDIENEFGSLALESKTVPRMAGRCSVFAKSDMIHLQQQATPTCDIVAGLCLALARNLKSNLGCGRKFVKPMIFTGGVAANMGVVRAIEQVFDLETGQLIVPKNHFFTGAIGAILTAKERENQNTKIDIGKIDNYLSSHQGQDDGSARRRALAVPSFRPPESKVYDELLTSAHEPTDAYIGVDVGSISTNVVVMDKQQRVLAKAYLMTAGNPLEAIRQGLDMVGKKAAGKVNILGAASTGSGRYLTGDFIGADIVINEITAQAVGAAIVNPKVDTIFEIGGQDSKYISLENGVVVDFEMNHACAAGTGSFLEEQAQRLGININKEFSELAFKSSAPIKLGERCTVFMESDLLNHLQQGAKTEDLVAGLGYSVAGNYLNRVVGRRKIGDNICFQGGTAFNHAVWSAFEMITGKKIQVPDHHEVTGALGAASIAAEHMKKINAEIGHVQKSKFRGFENLVSIEYRVESFTCEHCPNDCEIKKVELPGCEPLYYGSRCDRYNLKKKSEKAVGFDAFAYRDKKLLEFAGLSAAGRDQSSGKTTIGIPRALITWQLLPLFSQFFKSLGFEVVLSGKTNKEIIRKGVELVTAQPCFPVKVAYGHIAELIEKKVDHIFLPSIVSMTGSYPDNKNNQLCPYIQSLPYQVSSAFAADELGRTKILTAPLRLGEGKKILQKSFAALGAKLNVRASAVRKALSDGLAAQEGFEKDIKEKGKEILSGTKAGEKLFVLISRPYNSCDQGLSLELPKKLSALGIQTIPMDMLDLSDVTVGDPELHRQIYWSYGQKILRAAELIKKDRRLFAIYLSNFSCGPDSFLQTFFKDIMAHKPCLQLELDEHSADAGVITRLEAYLESLKHYNPTDEQSDNSKLPSAVRTISSGRTLYIPYMGDSAYGIAAAFRGYGQPAEVMPIADEAALLRGRQFTTGKECLPCTITVGEMLKLIDSDGFDPAKAAFFMPSGAGPCRFGMYNCMQRLILKYAGSAEIPVIAPNQDNGFYKELTKAVHGTTVTNFMKHVWSGAVGISLLGKVILRIRPFARDAQYAQKVYDASLARWLEAVESRCNLNSMCRVMDSIASDFKTIELDHSLQKPMIGIVGEIYVRSHPFANNNIIARLEKLGAVCDLASLAEWIYYTNFTRSDKAKRLGQYKTLFVNKTMNHFQHKIERKLAEPLEARFGKMAENPIDYVIALAEPYIHQTFEGEAILSVGKTVEYHQDGIGGVVNVMPFGCMPSTIVSTQTMRLSAACGDMPILNLSFDGQEDSVLTTRLEAFVAQVRQRQDCIATATKLIVPC